jgi:hypothetical protein
VDSVEKDVADEMVVRVVVVTVTEKLYPAEIDKGPFEPR